MKSMTGLKGILAAGGVLDRIVEAKATRLAELRARPARAEQAEAARLNSASEPRSMSGALRMAGRTNIIAEIKRRSPSKGVLREDFNPASIASGYEGAGAAAISVLTEEDFFDGSLEHLRAVRERVKVPVLRKDFIFDEAQIHEASAAGADAILLIVAILEDGLLSDLLDLSGELKIEALVEVHNAGEMERAARAGARLIGVNNRDLTTFAVALETSEQLAPLAPPDAVLVSESGINSGNDVSRLARAGYHAFLVGEYFMRAPDPGQALGLLIAEAESS
jgi:indole-3-glycerol phosphate synthase